MIFLRATIFNLIMVLFNITACIACLPFLFASRGTVLGLAHFYLRCIYWLERHVLGLDYVVRGREYLPENGPFIIAAKHQSQYETFKLHALFGDPAIILKRELIKIPLWGRFLAKIEPIAIDRKSAHAMRQIINGAKRVRDQGRPLVIFPQGTRVGAHQNSAEKPYKPGIAMIAEATGLPVIPMALNTGLFWPKGGWVKKPGTVVFEFLPPIPYQGDRAAFMATLEQALENASDTLRHEGTKENGV